MKCLEEDYSALMNASTRVSQAVFEDELSEGIILELFDQEDGKKFSGAAVKQLLAAGADVNQEVDGYTALMFAIQSFYHLSVRVLIAHGADIHRPLVKEKMKIFKCEDLSSAIKNGIDDRKENIQEAKNAVQPYLIPDLAQITSEYLYGPIIKNEE